VSLPTANVNIDETPYREDFDLVAGNTLPRVFAIQVEGVDKDLSEAEITFQAFDKDGEPVYVDQEGNPDPEGITPGGTNDNELAFPLTAEQTAEWSGAYQYRFDCAFGEGDGHWPDATRTLIAGIIRMVSIP